MTFNPVLITLGPCCLLESQYFKATKQKILHFLPKTLQSIYPNKITLHNYNCKTVFKRELFILLTVFKAFLIRGIIFLNRKSCPALL